MDEPIQMVGFCHGLPFYLLNVLLCTLIGIADVVRFGNVRPLSQRRAGPTLRGQELVHARQVMNPETVSP